MTTEPTESRVEDLFARVRENSDAPLGSAERTRADNLPVKVLAHVAELLEDTATDPDSSVRDSIEAQYILEHRLPRVQRLAAEAYEQAVDADPDARHERVVGELREQFSPTLATMRESLVRVNHYRRTGDRLAIPYVSELRTQFEDKLSEWEANGVLDYVRAAERGPDGTKHDLVMTPIAHYSVEDILAMMNLLVPENIRDHLKSMTRKKGEVNLFSSDGQGLNYPNLTQDFIKQYTADQLTPNASDEVNIRFSLVPDTNHPATRGKGIAQLSESLGMLEADSPWLREPYFLENVQTMLTRLAKLPAGKELKGAMATSGPSFKLPHVGVGSMKGVPVVMYDKIVKAGVADEHDAIGGRFSIE